MFKEHPVFILVPIASTPISSPIVGKHSVATPDNEPIDEVDLEAPNVVMDIPLRRLERVSLPTISDDYIVYLQEHEYDVGNVSNPTTYKKAIVSSQSKFWIYAMKDEMTSMSQNKVWSLIDLLNGYKPIGCK